MLCLCLFLASIAEYRISEKRNPTNCEEDEHVLDIVCEKVQDSKNNGEQE